MPIEIIAGSVNSETLLEKLQKAIQVMKFILILIILIKIFVVKVHKGEFVASETKPAEEQVQNTTSTFEEGAASSSAAASVSQKTIDEKVAE